MKEGPHTQIGNGPAEPAGKVVRLPRDWLGPHDELVPFGGQPPPGDDNCARSGDEGSTPPPSPEDFWGERSAAVHDAVPVGDEIPIGGRRARILPRVTLDRRSVAVASVMVIAAAGAIAMLLGGSGKHSATGTRLDIASVLRSGVARIPNIGPPRIVVANRRGRPAVRRVQHAAHRAPLTQPAPSVTPQRSNPAASTPTYAARATPASAVQSYRANVTVPSSHAGTSPPPPGPSPSSGATASPTGQLGALGPIQSPNG